MTDQDKLIELYGNPMAENAESFAAKWLTVYECKKEFPELPFKKIYCHKKLMPELQKTFNALKEKNLLGEIKTFDGCWNIRYIRGFEKLKIMSIHSWALAVDFNAAENGLNMPVKFSKEFLQVWRDSGWTCGADFKRVDGMHFEKII